MFNFKGILKSKSGFSLIEILVAVGVVAIALTIIVTTALAVQKTSRDAKRKTDMRTIQGALQQYYSDHNFYPPPLRLDSSDIINNGFDNCFGLVPPTFPPCTSNPNKLYLKVVPRDPFDDPSTFGDKHYCYVPYKNKALDSCDDILEMCHYYQIYVQLETSNPTPDDDCVDPSGVHDYVNYHIGPDE